MTMTQRAAVVGVFEDRAQAERAITELQRLGFTDDQIGFVARDTDGGVGTAASGAGTTGERVATGAVSGGVVGGLIGAAISLLIPGFGPAIAGGILAATLGGVAIGATAGGLIGALTGMGVPENEARYYQGEFEAGRVLVTVNAPGRQQEALDVLRSNGAYDATTRAGTYVPGSEGTYPQASPGTYDPTTPRAYDPAVPTVPPTSVDPTEGRAYNNAPGVDPTRTNPYGTTGVDPTHTDTYDRTESDPTDNRY